MCLPISCIASRARRGFGIAVLAALFIMPAAAGVHQRNESATSADSKWWQHAVIYEIYPRSFQDSNGDGIGDLNGITQRLDYLQALGVDAIWIAPMFPSPQVDFGYDITDYKAVDPQYGTLADFDHLLAEAAKHHIRVILDMVLNHTSDRHEWFIEASRSRDSPKHDFYVWNDGKTGGDGAHLPPNNWVSLFGGSAWEYLPQVNQFYYHKFYRQQPDLNWRNPVVEHAMFAAMRFWLDRGVAGFRLDAITTLFEDPQLRDEPELGGRNAQGDQNLSHLYTKDLPEVHGVIRRMRAMVDTYRGDRVLIGETYLESAHDLDRWYGGARHDELQLPMDTQVGFLNTLDARRFRQRLLDASSQIHGSTPLLVSDNHDNVRSWDRYADGTHDLQIAKLIATILLTYKGSALLYQGQEIGQRTQTPARIEDVRDPIGISGWPREKGRDGERTPMQWDTSNRQAGFSANPSTWLPVAGDYESINVAAELSTPVALLNWYRRLIELRRTLPALRSGRVVMLDEENPNVLTYARVDDHGAGVLISLNMSATQQSVAPNLPGIRHGVSELTPLLSDAEPLPLDPTRATLLLPPFSAWIGSFVTTIPVP
jgi:alpha-glucosidase